MLETWRLLRKEVTYSWAKPEEVNILRQLGYYGQRNGYFTVIEARQKWMRAALRALLGPVIRIRIRITSKNHINQHTYHLVRYIYLSYCLALRFPPQQPR